MKHLLVLADPFIVLLMATVGVASLLPPIGIWADVFSIAADIGVVLLFFLHGAKLSRQAIAAGARNWRLHLAVFTATYVMFPVLGLGMSHIPGIMPAMAAGLLFLTLLPSTVQSSIAFTSIAHGNVAAAVCSASFSNMAGVVLTPALVALLMHTGSEAGVGVSLESIQKIFLQLLLPFIVGHLLRPLIGGWIERQRSLVRVVDQGSILLVVYAAFGAAVVAGLWQQLGAADLALLGLLSCLLLAVVLAATWGAARLMKFSHEDAVVLLFCGSKKSLASGVPIASVLFGAEQVGMIILPLMIFHQIQLIVSAIIARRIGDRIEAMERETSAVVGPV